MTSPRTPRVFLCRGDDTGWALDEDRRLTALAIEPIATLVDSPADADVIHAPWWQPVLELPRAALAGKHVVCHLVGDLARCLSEPRFGAVLDRVTTWIVHSRAAIADCATITTSTAHIPYAVDIDAIRAGAAAPHSPRIAHAFSQVAELGSSFSSSLPAPSPLAGEGPAAGGGRGATHTSASSHPYVICSIARDTEGASLPHSPEPKLVKGPDVLLEIVAAARDMGVPVALLLGGPRRHWLRAAARARGIPVVSVGPEIDADDYAHPDVRLTLGEIGALLARADLHITTSRSEGGPRAILECGALSTPQLSTPVGHAPEILHPDCLFTDPVAAAETIARDFHTRHLRGLTPIARCAVDALHSVESTRERFGALYASVMHADPVAPRPFTRIPSMDATPRSPIRIWFRYQPAPWGGGNQFHHALRAELLRRGHTILNNDDNPTGEPCAHLIDSVQFDTEKFERCVRPGVDRVVHRFDGPVSMIRRTEDSLRVDQRILEVNTRYATATIVQSMFQLRQWASIGLAPRRTCMIPNASDPALFYPEDDHDALARDAELSDRPLRIVASSWSPNPGKGAATYAWLDEHLDPSRHHLTFVGQIPVTLRNSTHIDAVDSAALAAHLRDADVYLTASRWDPCSNALIEALSCGLPVLYINDGGHPELTGFAGLPFETPWQIPALLERIRRRRATYRALARPLTIRAAADRYLHLLLGPTS